MISFCSSSLFFICLWKWDLRNNEQSITGSDIPFFRTLTPFLFHPFGQIVGIEQSLISQPEFCSSTTLIRGSGVQSPDLSSYLFVEFCYIFLFNLLFPLVYPKRSFCIWRRVAGQRLFASFALHCIFFFHVVTEERRFDWKGREGGWEVLVFRLVWGGFTYVHLSI